MSKVFLVMAMIAAAFAMWVMLTSIERQLAALPLNGSGVVLSGQGVK